MGDYEERMREVERRAIDALDVETLYFLKGEHAILRDIVNKRIVLEAQYRAIQQQEEEQ